MGTVRTFLQALGMLGAVLFGTMFITSIVNPAYVEEVAKDIIKRQVENQVHEKIEALDTNFLSQKARHLIQGYAEKREVAKRQLNAKLPERIASVIAEMRNLDCECRKKIETSVREHIELQDAAASQAQAHLTTLIQTKYMETAEKLTQEFHIFTGTNAVVFALLALAAFIKRGAGLHLIAPASVLVVAATVTAYLYLFNQNWLHTVIYSDYVGFTYVGYLSVVFGFLCDVLFNRARVTTKLLNVTLNIMGSAVQVVPC